VTQAEAANPILTPEQVKEVEKDASGPVIVGDASGLTARTEAISGCSRWPW